jgi:hypothetical protein
VREPRLRLERSSLPAGLAAGAQLLIEVDALSGGDVIKTSPPRAVRLP